MSDKRPREMTLKKKHLGEDFLLFSLQGKHGSRYKYLNTNSKKSQIPKTKISSFLDTGKTFLSCIEPKNKNLAITKNMTSNLSSKYDDQNLLCPVKKKIIFSCFK